ncbi:MAG: radical SAM protein [Planctomycetes bacterium]|nr:radical SAM protein [Planctomycetota bacterium]
MVRIGVIVQGMLSSPLAADPILFEDVAGKSVLFRTCEAALRLLRTAVPGHDVTFVPLLLATPPNAARLGSGFAAVPAGVSTFETGERSSVGRYRAACERHHLDHFVRIIGNNVITSARQTARLVGLHLSEGADYSYGIGYPQGVLPSEVVSARALFHPVTLEKEAPHAVNITQSIKAQGDLFPRAVLRAPKEVFNYCAVNFSATSRETLATLRPLVEKGELDFTAPPPFFNAPVHLTYYISNEACNLNCVMCRLGELREKGHWLTAEQSRAIVEQFPTLGKVTIGSGEPLLSPHFVAIIGQLAARGAEIYLISNGSLISRRNVGAIVGNVTEMQLSMDGATRETYEAVREWGRFDRLLDSIRLLRETRGAHPAPRLKKVTAWFVYMERNYREMAEFVALMHSLGVRDVAFSSCFVKDGPPFDVKKMVIQDYRNLGAEIERARARGRELGMNVSYLFSEGEWRWEDCGAYQKTLTISHTGEVTACCMLKDAHPMGNLLTTHLIDLWNSDSWRDFRYALFTNKPTDVCARTCGFRLSTVKTNLRLQQALTVAGAS